MSIRSVSTRFLLLSLLTVAGAGQAAAESNPLGGWTHATLDGGRRDGVVFGGGSSNFSSPVIADLDGDPSNGKEVVAAGSNGRLFAYRADGTQLWATQTPIGNCGVPQIMSSPAVGRLHPGAAPSVVVGYGGQQRRCDGGVVAFDGLSGALQWNFSTIAYAKKARFSENFHAVFSTPALADVEGDGTLEIGFGSWDRHVYLLNSDGSVRFCYQAADTIWSSPAFANVDASPNLEMIVATDISANKRLKPATLNGGILYALRTQRRAGPNVRFRDRSLVAWMTQVDQTPYSSPVVAEVFPGNGEPEVIIGSGCYFPTNTNQKGGRWIKVFSLHTGVLLQTLNSPFCSPSSVAVGDLDDDGLNEIVATVSGDASIGGDGIGRVLAWKATNPNPIWQTAPTSQGYNDIAIGQFSSPILADLDGNGSLEVVVSNGFGPAILDGATGNTLTCADRGCTNSQLALQSGPTRATPAVGDLDNDGKLDLVTLGRSETGEGSIFAWGNFNSTLRSTSGFLSPYTAMFPMFRANAERNGSGPQ